MMSESKPGTASRLASQSGLIILGNLFTLAVGFPFQIYLARTLGADQLGAYGLFEVVSQTAAALAGLGLGHTLVRFIPEYAGRKQSRHIRELLAMVFSVTLLIGVSAGVLITLSGARLTEWLPQLRHYVHLLPFVGAMTILGMLAGLSAEALRAFLDIRYMVLVSSFLQLTLKVGIAVTLLWWGWQLFGYLVAVVVSMGATLAIMSWGLRGHLRRMGRTDEEVSSEARRSWRSYARTMYAGSLLGMAAAPAERFLLAGAIDLASVGVLMAVRQLHSLPQVLLQVIITVIAPMFVGARANNDMDEVKNLYHISTDWICRLGFPLLVFLLVFGDRVLGLYGAAFAERGHRPLQILLVAQLVNLATGPVGNLLNMLGHEKKVFWIALMSQGLLLACLFLLAPPLGLVGVALAGALSTIYLNLAALNIMKNRPGIRWWSARCKRLLAPLAACLIFALLVDHAGVIQGAWGLAMGLVAVYTVFALTYLSSGLTREDREIYLMMRAGPRLGGGKD